MFCHDFWLFSDLLSHQMEFLSYADEEERKVMQFESPIHRLSISNNQEEPIIYDNLQLFSPPSPQNQSPCALSPPQTPTPSLLYHCIASLHRHEGIVFSIAVSNGIVFTGSESNRIRAWKQPYCADRGCLKSSSGQVRAMLAHGNMLFSAHRDGRIRVWDFTESENFFRAKKIATLPRKRKTQFLKFSKSNTHLHQFKKDCVSCMAYYHAEGLLYTGSSNKIVKVFRVLDKKCVDSFVAHEDSVNCIEVSQEDGCVFTCSNDESVKIWRRICNGENSHILTMTLKFQQSPVNALALSLCSSNLVLYSGSSDGAINFWEKERFSGRFNHGGFLQGHRFAVLCLVAIERLIFSGSEDTTIRIWRREEGSCFHECLGVLDGHRGPVRCLAACLEMEKFGMGFLVYSAGLDQCFKVWRVKVLPGEKMCLNFAETNDDAKITRMMEYEMSPVLSPSWVEKKLNG